MRDDDLDGADAESAPDAALRSVDYGDAGLWRDDAAGALTAGALRVEADAVGGWEWVGADDQLGAERLDVVDRDAFARAAIDALSAGEEQLARALDRLTMRDLDPDLDA